MSETPLRARLVPAQGEPAIGSERIAVHHPDGRVEEVVLHDYARLYALPGVYEQIVQEDLGCRSPAKLAELLATAADDLGWPRDGLRAIDVAAGNGVSGEELARVGIRSVLGTDIVPEAREAALRDRPGLYGEYRTLDLLQLDLAQAEALRALRANVLCCVAPVGPGAVPPAAYAEVLARLAPDALAVHMSDPAAGPDPIDAAFLRRELGAGTRGERLHHERYLHRFTLSGGPYELEVALWRIRRDPASDPGRVPAAEDGGGEPPMG